MAIPDFQSFMLPVLTIAADGQEHSLEDAREALAREFDLSDAERSELLPSGRQRRFDNRVAWAKVFLEKAKLVSSSRRARFQITDRGRELLAEKPSRIDNRLLLDRYEEFRRFHRSNGRADAEGSHVAPMAAPETSTQAETPEEQLEQSYQSIRAGLAGEILARVKASTPEFFEQLVVDLLLRMGYGGNRLEAGRAIGGSGDEGIDGVINEDKLGLDSIYIQAKKWDGKVGRPEIQKFVGALHGKRARKGVFLTTGAFSSEAREYIKTIDPRVVLIDGPELANYMLDMDIGVTTKATFHLKRIDSDYFSDE
jgi:restriction system protein